MHNCGTLCMCCVHMCVHLYMPACIAPLCFCICTLYLYVHVSVLLCLYLFLCTRVHVCVLVCICVSVLVYVGLCLFAWCVFVIWAHVCMLWCLCLLVCVRSRHEVQSRPILGTELGIASHRWQPAQAARQQEVVGGSVLLLARETLPHHHSGPHSMWQSYNCCHGDQGSHLPSATQMENRGAPLGPVKTHP